ncbi:WLM-domain-containing protein [Fistulina hepatica ATCC 64428]|uniref:WLM-domain-containing protein n=1 Tax=Fistulina hepatica ATCC 64428 TaxID=1128425 RepID=A0A0D7AH48_9AGAR|nr:WLM-domain-containing protein [Fistulina hepatica ATCC 64428]
MPEIYIKNITCLVDRNGAKERALPLLKRVASLVKPIMRKHNWCLPVLSEFFPDDPNLLDINQGQQIMLRLRYHNSPDALYDIEDVVQVMLHELTHNVYGEHDDKFDALLRVLQKEYDDLRRSGYAGEGFFSEGQRLGGGFYNLPPHAARAQALEAAEQRRRAAAVLGQGGQLGGPGYQPSTRFGLREQAAQAAERRALYNETCTSGSPAARRAAAEAAQQRTYIDMIDLTGEPNDAGPPTAQQPTSKSNAWECPRCTLYNPATAVRCLACDGPVPMTGTWACEVCTLENSTAAAQCAVCETPRKAMPPPQQVPDQPDWTCAYCGEPNMPHEFWLCRRCGRMKTQS